MQIFVKRILAASFVMSGLFAADGPVLIDQDRAIAGSITQGDDPGFPITISQPGSYRLTGNLTVPDINTTAIEITTSSVTIDLNGFSIIGPVVCSRETNTCPVPGSGVGIRGGDPISTRGIRVTNGTVRGMGNIGIQLVGDGGSVERVTAEGNAALGIAVQGAIVSSTASRNGGIGLIGLIIRDSSALQNATDGIVIDAGGVASGNVSSFNGGTGIFAQYATVTGNTLFLNRGAAISGYCPSVISGNNIVSLDAPNFDLKQAGCVMTNNAVR